MDKLTMGPLAERINLNIPDDSNFTTVPNLQPYFKLHGSIDIKQSAREMLLVLGGDKSDTIGAQPLLTWYKEEFVARLNRSDTRLMIIGYGFGDQHINRVIFDAMEKGLKVFIIGPDGVDGLVRSSIPYNPPFSVKNMIVGASRRSLRNTLSGNDMVEYRKIERFFKTGKMFTMRIPAL